MVPRHGSWARLLILCVGLWLANGLLDAPLPDAAAKFVDQDREAERLAVGVCAALFEGDGSTHSRTDRAQYCLAHLRPGVGDWAAVPLPDSLSFLHYVIRPFRLAFRHLRPTAGHGM